MKKLDVNAQGSPVPNDPSSATDQGAPGESGGSLERIVRPFRWNLESVHKVLGAMLNSPYPNEWDNLVMIDIGGDEYTVERLILQSEKGRVRIVASKESRSARHAPEPEAPLPDISARIIRAAAEHEQGGKGVPNLLFLGRKEQQEIEAYALRHALYETPEEERDPSRPYEFSGLYVQHSACDSACYVVLDKRFGRAPDGPRPLRPGFNRWSGKGVMAMLPKEESAPLPALLPCRCGAKAELTTERCCGNEWAATVECSTHKESVPPARHTHTQDYYLGPEDNAFEHNRQAAINTVAARWNASVCAAQSAERDAESRLLACKCGERGRVFWQTSDYNSQYDVIIRCAQDAGDESGEHTKRESSTTTGIVDMERAKVIALDVLVHRWNAAPERTHALVHQEWDAAGDAVIAAQEKLRALRMELDALESKLLAERAEASK